jgi:hypothetical protein
MVPPSPSTGNLADRSVDGVGRKVGSIGSRRQTFPYETDVVHRPSPVTRRLPSLARPSTRSVTSFVAGSILTSKGCGARTHMESDDAATSPP